MENRGTVDRVDSRRAIAFGVNLHPTEYTSPQPSRSMSRQAEQSEVDEARDLYEQTGEIEIDDRAKVSDSDDGTWVQAWVRLPQA